MNIDFAAVLVVLTLLTGGIWLLDVLVLAPRRVRAVTVNGAQTAPPATGQLPWYVDISKSFFPVILAVLLLRSFLVEPFRIPSESMVPTLLKGDFILVNKFAYGLRLPVLNTKLFGEGKPARGDVAVFRYPPEPSVAYIKRVIGLPGDRLEYRNNQLSVNGQPMTLSPQADDPAESGYRQFTERLGEVAHRVQLLAQGRWSVPGHWSGLQFRRELDGALSWSVQVPSGHYFVMGDNRDDSADSRFWGVLPEENLIGRAFAIWMNLDCITFNGHCGRIGSSIQ